MKARDLLLLNKAALVAMAKDKKVRRYSRMTKDELVRSLAAEPPKHPKRKRSRIAARAVVATQSVEAARRQGAVRKTRKSKEKTAPRAKIYRAGRAKKKPMDARSRRPPTTPAPVPQGQQTKPPAPAEVTIEASKYVPADSQGYPINEGLGELPSHYDEDRLGLLPRDPRWLFAFWDVSSATRRAARRGGASGFTLRVLDVTGLPPGTLGDRPDVEIAVHDSDNWFVEIGKPGRTFLAQIGWIDRDGVFHATATSRPATTPWDSVRPDGPQVVVCVPFDVPLTRLRELLQSARKDGKSLAQALHEMGYGGDVPAGMSAEEFLRLYAAAQTYAPVVSSLGVTDLTGRPPSSLNH